MKKVFLICLSLTLYGNIQAQKITVKTGIEVLKREQFKCLEGKRVGLITNPTGVDNRMKSTIDILHQAPNVDLVALYGPEHGVRGDVHAGDKVDDMKDAATGLPVYSLYGKTRKATPEMLKDIDVLVYDIQDIGCRSFTYISTMGLAMEAAAENGKEFVVLDRPNPLGGIKIEGNLTEDDCVSFVSQFKIPYLYGLTAGELALMLNGERMLKDKKQCKLHVVKMKGWKRKMDYRQTGLQWVPSSPHIPHPHSAFFYPVSGILGELQYMSIGVGYTIPFQMFAAAWIEAEKLAKRLNGLNVPGVVFRPIHIKPFYSTGKGEHLQGVQVHITDFKKAPLSEIQFLVMQEAAALYPDRAIFDHADKGRFRMFDLVSGSKQIRERFSKRNRWEDIRDYWYKDVEDFRKLSKKYYLYK
ncbi:exo-beta-N-acetylmuramidase NamZ family protein [Bacteroides pyogenes]|uniref:exo-beta-N-acetylmuramidase NamZ family protein n=1 Tax=Bacteroides pyogenes TaxID=310300 RepID=UPI003FA12EE7